jgi:AbrB family looped-hinge helix DNA binding protein
METIITSKGEVFIPSEICRQLGIKENTHLQIEVDETNRKIILTPITREFIHSLRGKYRGRGLMRALETEKEQEKGY